MQKPRRFEANPAGKPPFTLQRAFKLLACVIIDILGYVTYAIPAIGEIGDTVWAPISAYLIYNLFGSKLLTLGGFAEEILPGSDFIPTATIAFFCEQMGWKIP